MFSGIGGICLGFKQVGFDIVWANDNDSDAVKTYKRNFGDGYIVEGDIRKINAKTIPDIDILTAGFPCQPFSIAGKQRGFSDARGNLFFEIARLIDYKRPKIVFLENVANLVAHDNGRTFLVIYNTLVQFGYYIKYKVMDAKDYADVPQRRERIFIVAFLDYDKCKSFDFPKAIPLKTRINELIDTSVKHSDCYYYDKNSFYYQDLLQIATDKNAIYKINDHGVGKKRYYICYTLMANMGTYPDRVPIVRDNYGVRKITPIEGLALQGFPNDFNFGGGISLNAAYKQIGNSVCVPVVKRIAEQIAKII